MSNVMNTQSTYTTDCLRKVRDEDGTVRVARMEETRAVSVELHVTEDKRVFWKGGRVA